jgi:hypothetical protein
MWDFTTVCETEYDFYALGLFPLNVRNKGMDYNKSKQENPHLK